MRAGFLLLCVLFSGCAALRTATPPLADRDPAGLRCWHMEGKVGVRDEHDSGSAHFLWQQREREFFLKVTGPLGMGAAVAYGDGSSVVMRLKDDQVMVGRTAQALVAQHFGWRVPFDEMVWWARGIPAPGNQSQAQRDAQGQLAVLRQDGWQVLFQAYEEFDGYQLPVKMELTQDIRRVRVRIKDWLPGECRLDAG